MRTVIGGMRICCIGRLPVDAGKLSAGIVFLVYTALRKSKRHRTKKVSFTCLQETRKPNSVLYDHLSGTSLARGLMPPYLELHQVGFSTHPN